MLTEQVNLFAPKPKGNIQNSPESHCVKGRHLLGQIAVCLVMCLFLPLAMAAEPSCVACHEAQKDLVAGSAHAQAGLSCVDCHGGNPRLEDEKAHATADFKFPKNKLEIVESCARCHSDVRRMNPYGLPTDQLARYKTSKHGEHLFEHHDFKVAVCTDCHGAHDILKSRSPQSRTHPLKIAETCGRCHGDAKLMGSYKLPADSVDLYRSSYHAALLFKKGDLSAPTCITCHGNHGATPPGTREVGQVCGKCHVRQRELFDQSPHAAATTNGSFKGCISCHSNHGIQQASVQLFDQSCNRCHANDPRPLAVRDGLRKLLQDAATEYARVARRVQNATVQGLSTEDEDLELQGARTQLTQMEALQHTLSIQALQPASVQLHASLQQTMDGIADLERVERWKRLSLFPLSAFLLLMAVLFWLKRRQLEQENDRDH